MNGLEKFESDGQEFDPNFHSAMFELEDESKTPGTVAVVTKVLRGYGLIRVSSRFIHFRHTPEFLLADIRRKWGGGVKRHNYNA